MKYDKANGRWLNSLLKKQVFEHKNIPTQEVKDTLGLEIKELVMCWLFENNNKFRSKLDVWGTKGALLNFKEIQGH